MDNELDNINETLKKIEKKIEDKSPERNCLTHLMDFSKTQEKYRRDREEKRNEEILKLQRIQTKSIANQESFNRVVAFTGGILALTAIYTFIVQSINLEKYPQTYWPITVIFLILILLCFVSLSKFIITFWKEEFFRK